MKKLIVISAIMSIIPVCIAKSAFKEPKYNSVPKYFKLILLNDREIYLAFDESAIGKGYDILYADFNMNNDLTDDKPIRGRLFQEDIIFESKFNNDNNIYEFTISSKDDENISIDIRLSMNDKKGNLWKYYYKDLNKLTKAINTCSMMQIYNYKYFKMIIDADLMDKRKFLWFFKKLLAINVGLFYNDNEHDKHTTDVKNYRDDIPGNYDDLFKRWGRMNNKITMIPKEYQDKECFLLSNTKYKIIDEKGKVIEQGYFG